ncbi:ribonuclease H family protein [Lentilactobacillus senioris]|uniref:ribonuclease H family protein n=1 Tax=Lentilactobacillus senioris TaxID=931534 RepID=UPI00227DCB09|nr:ribonuclease H family protein [Lentilactobacillus senioris]MCY9806438.1 ribonuclease H family protein [Lentilactobacillus senioris]
MGKFYAIKKGRKPGIYTTWDEAKKQVSGYSGAVYKGFTSRSQADAFMKGTTVNNTAAKTKAPVRPVTPLQSSEITFYTDGGSRNHGNVAGDHVHADDKAAWAYLIELPDQQTVSDSGGEWGATNNRMEIMGLIKALMYLIEHQYNRKAILAVLDSQYVLNAIQKGWLAGWKRKNWHRAGNAPLKNAELWRQVDQLLPQFSQLQFEWTKGHAVNHGNVFVDELLNQTMDQMKKTAETPAQHSQPSQLNLFKN